MTITNKLWHRLSTVTLYGASQLATVMSVLLISFVVVRWHSVALWGAYAELLIWSNVILLFLGFGSHNHLLRVFSDAPSKVNSLWASNLMSRLLLLVFGIGLVVVLPLFDAVRLEMVVWLVLFFLNASFRVLVLFRRDFTFNIIVEILSNALVIGGLIAANAIDINGLIVLIIFGQLLKLICYVFYYVGFLKGASWKWNFTLLKTSLPFFIPVAMGTFRLKMDAFYGTYYFDDTTLSQYQIFISFLMLAQMVGPFVLNPYLKNFYRSGSAFIEKLHKQFFAAGWMLAIAMTGIMYLAFTYVYRFQFTTTQYVLAFIFVAPLMVHTTLVNQYYKEYLQKKVAWFSFILVLLQVVLGYFLIDSYEIDGALALKVIGQWSIVIILRWWLRSRKKTPNSDVAV